ncbi:hypothetical protein EFL26_09620 [Nocardioides pocheonensis]|uniref:DUF3558 domain-containing protein n=1 Tax=Nocardioides pocheonensis TaxID=661485 RepID=A0A3N0GR49_9ACTN|nr:hypothetical protein EFL26_09620 [Nocardioides pocheonensis]
MTQRWATTAGALLLTLTLTSCGSDDHGGTVKTTVSGTCALHRDKYALSPVSADRLRAALGPGTYTLTGDVSSDDRSDEDAHTATGGHRWGPPGLPIDGSCDYADSSGVRRLSVGIGQKDLPHSGYDDARRTQQTDPRAQKVDGADGYVITEDVTDHDGSHAQQAVAVLFDGDNRYVTANILVPTKGVDSAKEAVAIAREALAAFNSRMRSA